MSVVNRLAPPYPIERERERLPHNLKKKIQTTQVFSSCMALAVCIIKYTHQIFWGTHAPLVAATASGGTRIESNPGPSFKYRRP